MLLRKKKYQEKLLETTDNQLDNIAKLTSDLEFSAVEQKVLDGLKAGNVALKKVHEILTVEEIERVLDETNEGIEKQNEIDAILNSNAESALTEDDEEAVLAELDQLIASERKTVEEKTEEENEEETEERAKDVVLPDVPTDEMPTVDKPVREKRRKVKEPVALEA